MKPKDLILVTFILFLCMNCTHPIQNNNIDSVIGRGEMPSLSKDNHGNLHLVFGYGDSLMYCSSSDAGQSFDKPELIAVVHELSASHTRGPQIACTIQGPVVTACTHKGNLFSFIRMDHGHWSDPVRINDRDTVAREQFLALAADGLTVFAAWLDLRQKHNAIYGAKSMDGGRTWSKNILIYDSPDGTVCECCKPSVAMKGPMIYIMFRNWLGGSRDLYLIQSSDGGNSFVNASKLGTESWKLNACPMDGGNLVLNEAGKPQTVWLRKSTIYTCNPGQPESAIGEGRSCTIESAKGKNVYAWSEKGNVVVINDQGKKMELGAGSQPQIKSTKEGRLVCVWENENRIYKAVVN